MFFKCVDCDFLCSSQESGFFMAEFLLENLYRILSNYFIIIYISSDFNCDFSLIECWHYRLVR